MAAAVQQQYSSKAQQPAFMAPPTAHHGWHQSCQPAFIAEEGTPYMNSQVVVEEERICGSRTGLD